MRTALEGERKEWATVTGYRRQPERENGRILGTIAIEQVAARSKGNKAGVSRPGAFLGPTCGL